MIGLNIEKIENKKTKVVLKLSIEKEYSYDNEEAFKKLMSIAILSGGSVNCLRQLEKDFQRLEVYTVEKLQALQTAVNELLYEGLMIIDEIEPGKGFDYSSRTFK